MYKVNIDSAGRITRESDNVEIGCIKGFHYSDFVRFPNTYRKSQVKLESGETVKIAYGGIVDGEFSESCHMKCVWGKHCLRYGKYDCMYNPIMTDVGFYVL